MSSTTLIDGDKDDGKTPCWSPATLTYCPEAHFNGVFQGLTGWSWLTICSLALSTTCRTPGTLVTGDFVICVEDSVAKLGPGFHWLRECSEWHLITTKPDHVPLAAWRGRGSAAQRGTGRRPRVETSTPWGRVARRVCETRAPGRRVGCRETRVASHLGWFCRGWPFYAVCTILGVFVLCDATGNQATGRYICLAAFVTSALT